MHILVLLPNDVEEIEFIAPVDIWRRANYTVTTASINDSILTTSQKGIQINADTLLKNVDLSTIDAIFLPGGSGHKWLRESILVKETIQYCIDNKKTIIAICAAPTILTSWLKNKKATCYPALADKIPTYIDQEVVVDLPFITSQGAGTAIPLALEVITSLSNQNLSSEIQKAIIFQQKNK